MRAVFLASYAPNAIKGLIAGSDREAAVKALAASVGATVESMMFTRGEYDVVVICNVPDQNAAVALSMATQASGAFTRMSLLEELDMRSVVAAAQNAAKAYKPAG